MPSFLTRKSRSSSPKKKKGEGSAKEQSRSAPSVPRGNASLKGNIESSTPKSGVKKSTQKNTSVSIDTQTNWDLEETDLKTVTSDLSQHSSDDDYLRSDQSNHSPPTSRCPTGLMEHSPSPRHTHGHTSRQNPGHTPTNHRHPPTNSRQTPTYPRHTPTNPRHTLTSPRHTPSTTTPDSIPPVARQALNFSPSWNHHGNQHIQDPDISEEADVSSEVEQLQSVPTPHPHSSMQHKQTMKSSSSHRDSYSLNLRAHSLTPHVARSRGHSGRHHSTESHSGQRQPVKSIIPRGVVSLSPAEAVKSGSVLLLKETKSDGSVAYFGASPVPSSKLMSPPPSTHPPGLMTSSPSAHPQVLITPPPSAHPQVLMTPPLSAHPQVLMTPPPSAHLQDLMSPPLSTHPQGLIKGDAPFYEEVTTPFHPTPLGLIGGRYTTSTPVAGQHVTPVGGQHVTPVGGRHATPVATVGRTTAPVDAQVQSDVKFIDQNIEVAPPSPYQNVEVVPPSPYQNVKVAPPSPHQNIKVAPPSPHQPNSPSLSSSTTNEDNRYSADLVDGIQETHKHILDKMKAQSDELYASFKAVSAKNTELLSENVTLKLKENRIDNLEKRLKQVKEERDQLQASLREKAHDVTMKEEECAHFESELTHLRKENLDYSRRLSQAREQVQGQKKDPRVLEELSKAMADKEALEKHCHQLQRTNSELKEELSRAVSQSISLQEHKAALDEIQEMVATDAQSGKEELAHKIKVMKRERKALLEQLAEYKVSASQLEQKCLFLEESAAEVASRMSSLEDEVESSRDREAVAHSQLSKAVSQAERALGERDSLSRLLKSHRELSASKEAKSKEKIRCLQKRLQAHKENSLKYMQEASEVLDHQAREHDLLLERFENEKKHLKQIVKKKQVEMDELNRDKKKMAEQLKRTQLQASLYS